MAEQSGFVEEYIREEGESVSQGSWMISPFYGWSWNSPTNQDKLWKVQRDIILDLAQRGSCVIVGRCADYILREKEDITLFRIFVYADLESRVKRCLDYGAGGYALVLDRLKEEKKI